MASQGVSASEVSAALKVRCETDGVGRITSSPRISSAERLEDTNGPNRSSGAES
jgi:hypothetical protein